MLSESDRTDLISAVADAIGADLTDAGIAAVLTANPALAGQIDEHGPWDTDVRSLIVDAIARLIVGRGWPKYGDRMSDEQLEEFESTLLDVGRDRGLLI